MFYCLERPSWLVSCIRLYKRGEFEIADWEILTFKLRTNASLLFRPGSSFSIFGGIAQSKYNVMPCRANYSLLCPNIDFRQVSDPGSLDKTSTLSPVFYVSG